MKVRIYADRKLPIITMTPQLISENEYVQIPPDLWDRYAYSTKNYIEMQKELVPYLVMMDESFITNQASSLRKNLLGRVLAMFRQ